MKPKFLIAHKKSILCYVVICSLIAPQSYANQQQIHRPNKQLAENTESLDTASTPDLSIQATQHDFISELNLEPYLAELEELLITINNESTWSSTSYKGLTEPNFAKILLTFSKETPYFLGTNRRFEFFLEHIRNANSELNSFQALGALNLFLIREWLNAFIIKHQKEFQAESLELNQNKIKDISRNALKFLTRLRSNISDATLRETYAIFESNDTKLLALGNALGIKPSDLRELVELFKDIASMNTESIIEMEKALHTKLKTPEKIDWETVWRSHQNRIGYSMAPQTDKERVNLEDNYIAYHLALGMLMSHTYLVLFDWGLLSYVAAFFTTWMFLAKIPQLFSYGKSIYKQKTNAWRNYGQEKERIKKQYLESKAAKITAIRSTVQSFTSCSNFFNIKIGRTFL